MQLIDRLTDYNLITKSWKEVYCGKNQDQRKASKGIDDVSLFSFNSSIDKNLTKLFLDVKKRKYKHLPLLGFLKKKPGKDDYRLITVPAIQDRIIERAMLKIISPYVQDVINTSVSYCGTKNLDGKKRNIKQAFEFMISHLKKGKHVVFESDIKSFFDEINKELLYTKIINCLPDSSLNQYIHDIIFFEVSNLDELIATGRKFKSPDKQKGISQGSPLSPIFANIYLHDFDTQLFSKFGDGLIRYVDDFIFICNSKDEAREFYKDAYALLRNLDLKMPILDEENKDSKTNLIVLDDKTSHFDFLGIKVTPFALAPKKGIKELREKFVGQYLNPNHIDYKGLSVESKVKVMNSKIKGYYDYYKLFHSDKALTSLNEYIRNQKKLIDYKDLKLVKVPTGKHIIEVEEWQKMFTI